MSLKYRTSAGTSASNFSDLVVKVGDTLPIGAIIGFDTTETIPNGWEYYAENQIKKISPVTPANGNIENQYGTSQTNAYSEAYVNSKLAEKLDAAGTAVNSTKWDGWTNDLSTYDGVNTWIPVLVNQSLKHTTIESIVDRGLLPQSVQTTAYYNFEVSCYKIGKLCIVSILGSGSQFTQQWTDYILAEISGVTAKSDMYSTFSDQQGRTGDMFILKNSNQIRINYRGATLDPNNAWIRGQLVFVTN